MGSACLKGFAVLHQCFDTIGFHRPGKAFAFGFGTLYHGDGHILFGKTCINFKDQFGLFNRLLLFSMGGMAFLPKEFRGPQEKAGTHFPSHYVGPLIDQQR